MSEIRDKPKEIERRLYDEVINLTASLIDLKTEIVELQAAIYYVIKNADLSADENDQVSADDFQKTLEAYKWSSATADVDWQVTQLTRATSVVERAKESWEKPGAWNFEFILAQKKSLPMPTVQPRVYG